MKEWTVMVYLAGDNNLSEECVWSLKEMYKAGLKTNKIALVVQIDAKARKVQHFDIGKDLAAKARERRYEAKKTGGVKDRSGAKFLQAAYSSTQVSSDHKDGLLSSRGHTVATSRRRVSRQTYNSSRASASRPSDSMATPEALTRFIKRSKAEHRAKRYLLILSGHGSGAIGDSFLVDGFPQSAFSMSELNKALSEAGGTIDVLGMDACGMGMAEVGYELRDSVDYLVAAEGFELNTGWPYDKVLDALNEKPTIKPKDLAARIVDDYTSYYSDYLMAGVATDLSACDLSRSEKLAAAVNHLARVLTSNLPNPNGTHSAIQLEITDSVLLSHWRAQSYRFEEYTDLWDFCDLLKRDLQEKECSDESVAKACTRVMEIIDGPVVDETDDTTNGYVISSRHSGGAFQHSHGVSIYFPWPEVVPDYHRLSFARKKKGWEEFLKEYVDRTRRPRRDGSGRVFPTPQADDSATVVRDVPSVGNRDVPSVGHKGDVLLPRVKNPPDSFHEHDVVPEVGAMNKRTSREW